MDHKVSKDMISSGMIPSGEKTQADLGRIQYGSNPSPSSLADAYKSMYEKKEEVINERLGLMKAAKLAVKYPKIAASNIGNPRKPHIDNIKRAREKGFFKGIKGGEAQATAELRKAGDSETLKADKRSRISQIMANNENVDLLSAYHAVYEHHKKDADGNTIPHEGEEINEALPLLAAPLVAKGLMALKGAKVGAAALKGAAAFKKGLMTAKGAAAAGKITTTGGKVLGGTQKVGMAQKAGSAVRSAGAAIKNNPMSTALVATSLKPGPKMPSGARDPRAKMTGARTAGVYASADLFDIVKGQLLDEGIDEKDVKYIMVNLTPDEILNEVSAKLLMKASRAADMKRAQLARAGDKAGAAAKASQATSLYQGAAKRNIAKQDLSKPLNPQRKDYPMGKGANYQQKPGM